MRWWIPRPSGSAILASFVASGRLIVFTRHDRASHDDLADHAVGHEQVIRPDAGSASSRSSMILTSHPGDWPADTHSQPRVGRLAGFTQYLAAADRRDRQCFGRPVRRIDLGRLVEQVCDSFRVVAAETGAPAEMTRFKVGSRRDWPRPRAQAGATAPASQTGWSHRNRRSPRRAWPDRPAPAASDPCRARSPSFPARGQRGQKEGNVQRSTSPGSIA